MADLGAPNRRDGGTGAKTRGCCQFQHDDGAGRCLCGEPMDRATGFLWVSAWLVERGLAVNHTPTVYWVEGHEWTEDPWKAARFDSQDEANDQIRRLSAHISKPTAIAVSHGFQEADRG